MRSTVLAMTLILASTSGLVRANMVVPMNDIKTGKEVGTITLKSTPYGTLLVPDLKGVLPGPHGFHLHVNASCDNEGKAAGGHLDPAKTQKHLGPYNPKGHLGDLPVLHVNARGEANTPVLAPRLKIWQFKNRSLMIHAGGDNYSDEPKPLGGGGSRMICGVVKNK